MARRRKPIEKPKFIQIPMTPMIDIIFQLLIFFMLSIKFKDVEGKLQSSLPKDKGLWNNPVPNPEIKEVRIKLKYDKTRQRTSVSSGFAGKEPVGELIKSKSRTPEDPQNFNVYRALREKVLALYRATPSSRDNTKPAPVILEATPDTPYEHVVGCVNACKEVDIPNVEFSGNPDPKFMKELQEGARR